MKYKVKVPWESAHKVTLDYLKDTLSELKEDHKQRKNGHALAIFKHDINEDLSEIKRHIKAIKTVILYCGEKP